jgi:ribonuclease VapC
MVVDTSAILAILFKEAERDAFVDALGTADLVLMGTPTALESSVVVLARKGPAGVRELDLLLHKAGIVVVPFTPEHLTLARDAYERFRKGRHLAGLNLGDACAYAVAAHAGEPLLFKGDGFVHTDIAAVLTR